jgi:hypothetical protein
MKDNFDKWLQVGIKNNWCGPAICYTHDGLPISERQSQEFEEGGDPCLHIIRLYEDVETKQEIEDNHPPSVWRAPRNK